MFFIFYAKLSKIFQWGQICERLFRLFEKRSLPGLCNHSERTKRGGGQKTRRTDMENFGGEGLCGWFFLLSLHQFINPLIDFL